MFKLSQRVVLVTGASRGIGKVIADYLGKQGATVIGTATSEQGAAAISDHLAANNISGQGVVLDVTNTSAVEQVVENIQKQFGTIAILVNNAGITRDNLLLRMREDEWNAVIATNLTAVYTVTKACLKGMLKSRWGRIITIGSVVGSSGNPGQTNYCAAKAGVIGFSKSLAHEVASRNITVNVVAPGFIKTDMTKTLSEQQQQALLEKIPVGYLGQPEDVAAAVVFLASPEAGYITGQVLHVNGGLYL